jgi:hypothetical protein
MLDARARLLELLDHALDLGVLAADVLLDVVLGVSGACLVCMETAQHDM